MEIDEHARTLLIAYLDAHELWKDLPLNDDKVKAKAARGLAHSKALDVIRLLKYQKER
jgi:hypothetical protein